MKKLVKWCISTKINEIGNLEVLRAGIKLRDYHSIGDDYSVLYVFPASAIFTVDLNSARIVLEGNQVTITLNEPSFHISFDESKIETIAEWQKYSFSGTTVDGVEAYRNSRTEIEDKTRESIHNDDTLIGFAKESAENQIEVLVRSINSGVEVKYNWVKESLNEE